MPESESLLLIERFNVAPGAEDDWKAFGAEVLEPRVAAASGTDNHARYVSRGQPDPVVEGSKPEYLNTPVDWEEWDPHVVRVYQYVNLYEVVPSQLDAVLAAAEQADAAWTGTQAHGDAAYGIRVAYERYGGILPVGEMPELYYVTRYNIPIERRATWEENYAPNHKLDTDNATGRPGIGRASCYRMVGIPLYVNWWGPSSSYQYFNIYELSDEKTGIESSYLSRKIIQGNLGKEIPPPSPGQLTGVRSVYQKLT